MSVYSGFATRQQEHKYNNLIETLVIALKKRVIKFYAGEACDENKFKILIKKIYKKMFILEKGKFMTPKYTSCFTDLIDSLNIEINYDSMSDASSMMSQTFSLRKQSTEDDGQAFKSNAMLTNKKNLLEVKSQQLMNTSIFSLNKLEPNNRLENEEQEPKKKPIGMRSTSLQPFEDNLKSLKPKKLKNLKELKDLRGTINMPKVQDFLPKKQEIQPGYYIRKNTFIQSQVQINNHHQNNLTTIQPPSQKVVFRRNKYSKQDVQVQQI